MPMYMLATNGGPLIYFSEFANAIAYWNYLEFGNGKDKLAEIGVHAESIELFTIKTIEDNDPEFMAHIHSENDDYRKRVRLEELSSSPEEVCLRTDQEQGNRASILAPTEPD